MLNKRYPTPLWLLAVCSRACRILWPSEKVINHRRRLRLALKVGQHVDQSPIQARFDHVDLETQPSSFSRCKHCVSPPFLVSAAGLLFFSGASATYNIWMRHHLQNNANITDHGINIPRALAYSAVSFHGYRNSAVLVLDDFDDMDDSVLDDEGKLVADSGVKSVKN